MTEAIKTIDPKEISVPQLHGLLLSAVAPRPICLASTIDKAGNVNLSPYSFFNVFSTNPPIMIFSPARRGRDNTTKHTYENVKEVQEVVINIVNHPMVEQMSLASTEYEKGINEFMKAGFTQVPSKVVKPPRVGEAPFSFECKVDQIIALGDQGGAGNLVLANVVKIHVQEKFLDENLKVDSVALDLVSRMGENWYSRCTPESMFEVPKPTATKGIGVDSLPYHIRNSSVLTGNHLGRLGNMEELPSESYIEEILSASEIVKLKKRYKGKILHEQVHHLAASWIARGMEKKAQALLWGIS